LVGTRVEVLVDGNEGGVPVGRTHREAPEIDGVVRLAGGTGGVPPTTAAGAAKDSGARVAAGTIVTAEVVSAVGPDLVAEAA
jgi:hypothetical protein